MVAWPEDGPGGGQQQPEVESVLETCCNGSQGNFSLVTGGTGRHGTVAGWGSVEAPHIQGRTHSHGLDLQSWQGGNQWKWVATFWRGQGNGQRLARAGQLV